MSVANSHITPLPDVNTYKYQRYADCSVSQGGFPQPGNLHTGWAVCVTCPASAEHPPRACPRCGTHRRSSRNDFFRGWRKTELRNLNLLYRCRLCTHIGATSLIHQPRLYTGTGFPGFCGWSTRVAAPRVHSLPPSGTRGQRRDLAAGKRCLPLPATCLQPQPRLPGEFEPALPAAGGTGPVPLAPGDASHPCAAKMVEGGFTKLFQKRSFLRLAQKYQPLGSGEQEEKVRIAYASCLDLLK